LQSGCKAFGVENGKGKGPGHGQITKAYIDYNRQDVRATAELAFKVLEEYDRHPIDLQETKAYWRASAHIRKCPVPVIYTDFLSMYTSVNSLMNLWPFVIAAKIMVVEHCHQEIQGFLDHLTAEQLFNPETRKRLTAFALIIPDGDILPTRGKYSTGE
jgi:hypothetical protein